MGRPLRRHEPGQLYLVTTRCHQARFFLRPDRELNEAVLEWLARAQLRFPRLRILAICVMSNHLHLVVRDEEAELAAWAGYFLCNLACAVNRIRGRSGTCFERRYSAEPILDDEALIDRLAYVVANPVKAGLCKRARDWPGVVLYAAQAKPLVIPVSWLDRDRVRFARVRARLRSQWAPKHDAFRVQGSLIITPFTPTHSSRRAGEAVTDAIEARERELAQERRRSGRKTLTRKQVLAQRWQAAPPRPQRSPRPLCHASDAGLRKRYREGFHEFVSLFREASARLRAGEPNARFPAWCYPPGGPLLRPPRVYPAYSGAG